MARVKSPKSAVSGQRDSKGRPPGAENREYDHADAPPSRCQRCDSTDRTAYSARQILRGEGTHPTHGRFNVVVLRATACCQCGQWRKDRTLLLTERELSDTSIDDLVARCDSAA